MEKNVLSTEPGGEDPAQSHSCQWGEMPLQAVPLLFVSISFGDLLQKFCNYLCIYFLVTLVFDEIGV